MISEEEHWTESSWPSNKGIFTVHFHLETEEIVVVGDKVGTYFSTENAPR